MSTLAYGALTRKRLATAPPKTLATGQKAEDRPLESIDTADEAKDTVSHWQDVLVGLVPAEVLALHGVAMTLGTTTTTDPESGSPTTVITNSHEMRLVFVGMAILAVILYFSGVRKFGFANILRALIAPSALVLWTMIQPGTAFDAFGFTLSPLLRTFIAIGGAILLGIFVNLLSTSADRKAAA